MIIKKLLPWWKAAKPHKDILERHFDALIRSGF